MRNEADVKKHVKRLLKQYGVWYCMPSGTGFGTQGVPDFICCASGLFLAIETKFGKNKPTALQVLQIDEIEKAQGNTFVANEKNLHQLENLLLGMTHEDAEGDA